MARDKENQKRLAKEWYERNKDLAKERARQWALNNPEKKYAIHRKNRDKDRENHNARNRDWNSRNQDKKTAYEGKRRAAKLQRTPNWLTDDELELIQALYSVAAMFTKTTGIPHHVDHIIPLQGELVSGLHVYENLRVIPAVENLKKSNKHDI
jgi:hypothetical protein